MSGPSAAALRTMHADPNRKLGQTRSKSEIALEKFHAKKAAEDSKTKQQKLKEEIDRVQRDTLKMFTQLAQMPDINGKGDNIQQMTNMTLAVQQMEMAKFQTEQTGELIKSNGTTQLLIAASYNGRQAEVMDNTLTVKDNVVPRIVYEVPCADVGSVRVIFTNTKSGESHSCKGPGEMAKHTLDLDKIRLPNGQYKVKVTPLDKSGRPMYANEATRELMRIPTFTVSDIRGWELDKGQLSFTNGVSLHSVDKLKQILVPEQPRHNQGTGAYSDTVRASRAAQKALAEWGA